MKNNAVYEVVDQVFKQTLEPKEAGVENTRRTYIQRKN